MKQKLMNRVLGFVLSFGLVLGCVTPVMAAEVPQSEEMGYVESEKEAALSLDDLNSTAVVLKLDEAKSGVLERSGEEDYYKFTLDKKGYFNLKFAVGSSTDPDDIGTGWSIEIYKESDTKTPVKSVSGVTAAYTFPKLAMDAGNYYIKVYSAMGISAIGCAYSVMVDFTESAVWEVESNNEKAQATVMKQNTTFFGNLYDKSDMDWYKIEVQDEGAIQFSFRIDQNLADEPIGSGWSIVLYNSSNEALRTYTGVTKDFTAQKLPFSKGTYYVKIYATSSLNAPVDCTYEVKLDAVKGNWESEYNDLKTSADVIQVGTTYNGTLYDDEDVDYYKVTTTETGYFKVGFALDETVNPEDIANGWNVTIYDKNLNAITTYTGLKESKISGIIPYEKGIFYIKVSANSRYSAPVDCIYNIQVTQYKSSVWETEGNDERKFADSISLNKTYSGILMDGNDKDWFKFATKAIGTVMLTFKLADVDAADNVANGWNISIYKEGESRPEKEITGVLSKESLTVDLEKGTYFVKVAPNNRYAAPEQCEYSLVVNYSKKPSKVTIKSVKAGKKKATLSWKKVSNADGYIIYRSTSKNGTYKKIKTITKNSTVKYVDKKLKKGKRYYYKVVAYKKTNGITSYGADSNKKSVKVK